MGRIIAHVFAKNLFDPESVVHCDALVGTGSAHMVFPTIWKERLGKLNTIRETDCESATQQLVKGEVCGPVEIEIEGFDPVYSEILFLDMEPEDGRYEPLIGYIILEQAQIAVDMLGHRPIHAKKTDLKKS